MEYRIEYANGRCFNYANSRKDLIEWLKLLKNETISDIRKVYKSGVSDSVMDIYKKYIVKGDEGNAKRSSWSVDAEKPAVHEEPQGRAWQEGKEL